MLSQATLRRKPALAGGPTEVPPSTPYRAVKHPAQDSPKEHTAARSQKPHTPLTALHHTARMPPAATYTRGQYHPNMAGERTEEHPSDCAPGGGERKKSTFLNPRCVCPHSFSSRHPGARRLAPVFYPRISSFLTPPALLDRAIQRRASSDASRTL